MLIIRGFAILAIEQWAPLPRHHDVTALPAHVLLRIGLFQCLAVIPGVSRSDATIMRSLLMRVDRWAATEFSFFIAIPTMLVATIYNLYKNREVLSVDNSLIIAVGFTCAFLAALSVVHTVITFVSNHGFLVFALYRILMGSLVLVVLALR